MLSGDHWQKMSPVELSFIMNGLIGMPAGVKQDLLEMRQPQQRLDAITFFLLLYSTPRNHIKNTVHIWKLIKSILEFSQHVSTSSVLIRRSTLYVSPS